MRPLLVAFSGLLIMGLVGSTAGAVGNDGTAGFRPVVGDSLWSDPCAETSRVSLQPPSEISAKTLDLLWDSLNNGDLIELQELLRVLLVSEPPGSAIRQWTLSELKKTTWVVDLSGLESVFRDCNENSGIACSQILVENGLVFRERAWKTELLQTVFDKCGVQEKYHRCDWWMADQNPKSRTRVLTTQECDDLLTILGAGYNEFLRNPPPSVLTDLTTFKSYDAFFRYVVAGGCEGSVKVDEYAFDSPSEAARLRARARDLANPAGDR